MLIPTLPGWKVETIGDDICWMKFGRDGRLWAINPEYGFFGVAPGTNNKTNLNAMLTLAGQLHLHQHRPHRRRRRVVGGHDRREAGPSDRLEGPGLDAGVGHARPPTPTPGSPPRRSQDPAIAPEWEDPAGVPISAILFGGRRSSVVPLITEAFDWQHGVFLGSIMASETTAAAAGAVGKLRRDPFAMLPVLRLQHGRLLRPLAARSAGRPIRASCPVFSTSTGSARAPTASSSGPATARTAGCSSGSSSAAPAGGEAVETPDRLSAGPGRHPADGLDVPAEAMAELLRVDADEWRQELQSIAAHFDGLGDRMPPELLDELARLEKRLG